MQRPFPAYTGSDPYVFVSYSHADEAMAFAELQRINDAGFNVWYDDGIEPGSTWRDEVALALANCHMLLFFVTRNAVLSPNCQQELNFALTREKKVLCVHLEPTELPPGMELSLSDKQALMRFELNDPVFEARLREALGKVLAERPAPAIFTKPIVTEQDARESVAVLPLANRNLDADLDYLSDGVAEELIRGLAQVEGLRVASQIATFKLKDLELAEVGRRLNVDNVLSGSIQRAGDRLRVNVLLSQVADGSTLWTQRYDGTLEDVFDFQDDVARQVVEALRLELSPHAQAAPVDVGTRDARAYQAYLLGEHARRKSTLESAVQAEEFYRQAITYDPDYIRAYGRLSTGLSVHVGLFNAPRAQQQNRLTAILPKLEELDPERKEFDWRLIEQLLSDDHDVPTGMWIPAELAADGIRHLRDPHHAETAWEPALGHFELSRATAAAGLLDAGIEFAEAYLARQSSAEDFHQTTAHETAAYCAGTKGDFEKAFEHLDAGLEENNDRFTLRVIRCCLYSRTGQYRRAAAELELLAKVAPKNHAWFSDLFWRGETADAVAYFDDLARRPRYALWLKLWGSLMLADEQLGDSGQTDQRLEAALDYLDEGLETLNWMTPAIRYSAGFYCPESVIERLTANERYQAWLVRAGLDDSVQSRVAELINANSDVTGIEVRTAN